ncbi:MAG: ABC transporter ATP-binding protein [Kiritimatiellae bacterium]|nr:ABC transporter ATP-binding protein [Kiritimatiellia bacterium]MDW8458277.1 ABC transporter ATP-binding protein [Verrucomicrobiota bacterium]
MRDHAHPESGPAEAPLPAGPPHAASPSREPLLRVRDLVVEFDTDAGPLRAVDGVSFDIYPGETVGLVGESGCGKTVTALSLLRLLPSPPARIQGGGAVFEGRDLLRLPIRELRSLRGKRIGFIFQDPMTALSPLRRVGDQLMEVVLLHEPISKPEARALAREWLARVGIPDPDQRMRAWPHELSGGMRQRVMIAMALMLHPSLVIADEPTTALDVTIQAQIFDLMRALKDRQTAILLITHDLGIVWDMCDRAIVMYAGRIAEVGPVRSLFAQPRHPYTAGLLRSLPRGTSRGGRLQAIPGQVPPLSEYASGCRFADRCPHAMPRCRAAPPLLTPVGEGHAAACVLVSEGRLP